MKGLMITVFFSLGSAMLFFVARSAVVHRRGTTAQAPRGGQQTEPLCAEKKKGKKEITSSRRQMVERFGSAR